MFYIKVIILLFFQVTVFALPKDIIYTIHNHHYLQPSLEILKTINTIEELNNYLSTLDAYSYYLTPKAYDALLEKPKRINIGLGLHIIPQNNLLLAIPYQPGAAYEAGFKQASWLLSINNQGFSETNQPWKKLGRTISIQVAEQLLDKVESFDIASNYYEKISLEIIEYKNYNFIRIYEFISNETKSLLEQQVKDKSLILDLRYCTGGSLYEAIDSLALFLSKDTPLIKLKNNQGIEEEFKVKNNNKIFTQPVYILISPYTASAAEIFALILAYYNKAVLIGLPSFGKCLVQKLFPLVDGGALQLTLFEALAPDNSACHNKALYPHIEQVNFREDDLVIENIEKLKVETAFCYNKTFMDKTKAQQSLQLLQLSLNNSQAFIFQNVQKQWFACIRPTELYNTLESLTEDFQRDFIQHQFIAYNGKIIWSSF